MKRFITAALAVVILLGLLGCNNEPTLSSRPTESTGSTKPATQPSTEETQPTTLPTTVPTTQPLIPDIQETTMPAITTAPPPTTFLPATVPTVTTQPPQKDPATVAYSNNTLVRVQDYIPDIVVELRYASDNNFTGKAIYDFQDAYLRYGTVKKLMKVQEALREQGLSLKIWDAYRPVDAQYLLWEANPNITYIDNPSKDYSSHTQGDTVDIILVDANGNDVNMPSDYDVFSTQGDRDYTDCSAEQKANAMLLQNLMKKHGFSAYFEEWWHYSDKDYYADNTAFDPGVVSVWYANCNTYLTLRKTPYVNGAEIGRVKAGESVILMGWHEKFALVDYKGVQGYVLSEYLAPESQWDPSQMLKVVKETNTYTYEQMQQDIATLAAWYPDLLQVSSIGNSELGRDLTLLKVGDPNAEKHVIIHAAIHAREHMTTWMVMAMVDYWLSQGMAGCEDTCFHIIPMLNPDGVHLVQTATFTQLQLEIYKRDKSKGNTNDSKEVYASTWKANGLGVDLNRNFDASWKETYSRKDPSSERYKGTEPFCAAEAAALRDYTLALMPDATISYHSTGSVIYWQYGSKKGVKAASQSLGQAVLGVSGYPLIGQSGLDAGGYKDWCMEALEIPSLTIEIGCGFCPLPLREIYSIFIRNIRVLPTVAQWVQSHT